LCRSRSGGKSGLIGTVATEGFAKWDLANTPKFLYDKRVYGLTNTEKMRAIKPLTIIEPFIFSPTHEFKRYFSDNL